METKLYAMVWKAKGESDSEWRVSWKISTDIDFLRQLKAVEDIREQNLDHAIVEIRFVPETEADPQFEPFPTTQAPEPYPVGSLADVAPGVVTA